MRNEVWKDVVGYEALYQVSTFGRVRSLNRTVDQISPYGELITRKLKGCILKTPKFSNEYLGVHLGRGKANLVHRLVAEAFVDGDTTLQVNHKNGKRNDNRPENLEWVTCSENHLHSYQHLHRKKHGLTRKVLLIKGNEILSFDSGLQAANYLNVVPGSVSSAATREHKCLGYEVSYV